MRGRSGMGVVDPCPVGTKSTAEGMLVLSVMFYKERGHGGPRLLGLSWRGIFFFLCFQGVGLVVLVADVLFFTFYD